MAIFNRDYQQGSTVQHRELCSVLCESPDGRGIQGSMGTCVCGLCESPDGRGMQGMMDTCVCSLCESLDGRVIQGRMGTCVCSFM